MKRILSIMLAAVMMISAAACGTTGDSDSKSSTADSRTETTVSSSAPEDSSAGDSDESTGSAVDAIKESGKLVMLTNATFPPYEYFKGNEIQGIDAELAKLIADELGVELEIVDMNFDLLIDAVNSGKGNIVAAGMSITDERKKAVDFSIPYIDTQLVVIVKEGSDIKSFADFDGKKISVQESTTSDLYLSDTEDVAPSEIMRFKSAVEAGNALSVGKSDGVLMDKPTAENVVAANEGMVILTGETVSEEQYAMAVPKGQEDFLAVVDEVLQKAVDEGQVDEFIAYHMKNYK